MKERALWERIESVEFADPNASLDFIHRLMRENQWSHTFVLNAVFEYKRFVYLAMVCEHEVTPSDEVDQVWHLHLQYSRHYWGEWTDLLGKKLHHGPTKGGEDEDRRYKENYAQTLASYEKEFGEPAPTELWPDASIRFSRPQRMVRMDRTVCQRRSRGRTTLAVCLKTVVVIVFIFCFFKVMMYLKGGVLLFFVIVVMFYAGGAVLFSVIDKILGIELIKAKVSNRSSGTGSCAVDDGSDDGSGCGGGGGCSGCGGD